MTVEKLFRKCQVYLEILCGKIDERCTGSEGNRQATSFFEKEISLLGWDTELAEFDAIDWEQKGAVLKIEKHSFELFPGPFSLEFKGCAELISASSMQELENVDAKGKIILLHGEIAREQLMPKNFVFYNPEEHQKIISLLEKAEPAAIISATGRNSALAGGVYPFPMIEDGDFNIPSVYTTEEEGQQLASYTGKTIFLESRSKRIPGKGYNVIARKGATDAAKIVVTAHVDAKKGTPGAIDNASGIIVLLLLADLLNDYRGDKLVEIVALNGEDHYAVPGQMNYIMTNNQNFNKIVLNINIDGAGYKEGPTAFSLFNLPESISKNVRETMDQYHGITEGIQWPQGDHSIFLQYGIPAIAVSSKWFIDNMSDQDITHTPKDNPEIVDCCKLVEIANALNTLIRKSVKRVEEG